MSEIDADVGYKLIFCFGAELAACYAVAVTFGGIALMWVGILCFLGGCRIGLCKCRWGFG